MIFSTGRLPNKDIFCLIVSPKSIAALVTIISGCIPTLLSSIILFCVGLVFNSFEPNRNGTRVV